MLLVVFVPQLVGQDIDRLAADPRFEISVSAANGQRWMQDGYEVWHLRGNCRVKQAAFQATSQEVVLWVDRADASTGRPTRVVAYFEGQVQVDTGAADDRHPAAESTRRFGAISWTAQLNTFRGVNIQSVTTTGAPAVQPAVYQRGMASRAPQVRQAQFETDPFGQAQPVDPPPARRVIVRPRSNVPVQASVTTGATGEQMAVITSGVRMVIEGAADVGRLDIETDRIVIWAAAGLGDAVQGGESVQSDELPLEFYLEGNIVFRESDRVIYAQRMYYNVATKQGTILDAEILTPVPDYQGTLRLKADVVQQLDGQHFQAFNAAATSSRMGVPRYWIQSNSIELEDIQIPRVDPFTGQTIIDPESGEVAVDHELAAVSRNNFIYVGGIPVFYWPVLWTDLEDPTYYVKNVRIRSDSVFGNQILVDFDAYQLLGIDDPFENSKWELSTDYLSDRGPALGTELTYSGTSLFGRRGAYFGRFDAWGIRDSGLDNLGGGRRRLTPEEEYRGRILARHRQMLSPNTPLSIQFGAISDRNFQEQYFEREWDEDKDLTTGIDLKHYAGNASVGIQADYRLNDFFTQTEWLPRADGFVLGSDLGTGWLTYYAHVHAGYARLRTAVPPQDATDAATFDPLAWESEREGVRAGIRQEINAPVDLGPVKVVPYGLFDATYWGETLDGSEQARLYGQGGFRASLPMWKVDHDVQSTLFNLDGLAHKVVFETDVFYADADQNLDQFPLYDSLDDDSQEAFRRRLLFSTFGGSAGDDVDLKFDERFFAFRNNMQGRVTGESAEIADDLMAAKFGVRQRWQTRRGLPGQQRVIDWIVLDVEGTFFPDAERDNFGANVGLLDYDFRWHVGDRLTMVSDGYFDLFGDGLRTASVGGILSRPEIGNLFLGYRSIEGPFSASIARGSFTYRVSEKWIATAGVSYDFGGDGRLGHSFSFTRIGESFLMRVGFRIDTTKQDLGLTFAIEPRFLPGNRLGSVGGVRIPPAGSNGLE